MSPPQFFCTQRRNWNKWGAWALDFGEHTQSGREEKVAKTWQVTARWEACTAPFTQHTWTPALLWARHWAKGWTHGIQKRWARTHRHVHWAFSEGIYVSQTPEGEGVMMEGEKGPDADPSKQNVYSLRGSHSSSGHFRYLCSGRGLEGMDGGKAPKTKRAQITEGHKCLFGRQRNYWEPSRGMTWAGAHFWKVSLVRGR